MLWLGTQTNDQSDSYDWHPINGESTGRLPNTPINALLVDDVKPDHIYVGTDIGVFRTLNKGKSWFWFSENLPVCAVYDIRLQPKLRILRVATHGRGIWERQLDVEQFNEVNLFFRNHIMDTGYPGSSSLSQVAAFSDSLQNEECGIKLNDSLSWDMCPDIKIDSPDKDTGSFQIAEVDSVDYVIFENRLQHKNLRPGDFCILYVQIHNRGIRQMVEEVSVRLFYANKRKDGTYPNLSASIWRSLSPTSESNWIPIVPVRILPQGPKTLTNTEPTVIALLWYVTGNIEDEIGILAIVESPEDPISENSKKITDIKELVTNDRHVGLKTVKVIPFGTS